MNSSEDTIPRRERDVIDKLRGAAEEVGALPWGVTADSVMAGPVRHRRLRSPAVLRIAVVVFVALIAGAALLVSTSRKSSTTGPSTAKNFATLADIDVVSSQLLYAYASDSAGWNLVRSTDGGSNWQDVGRFARTCNLVDLAFVNEQQGVADCGVNLIVTRDGGRTWTQAKLPGQPVYGFNFADVGNVLVARDGTIWAETTRCRGRDTHVLRCPVTIFASTTGGAGWVDSGFSIKPWSLEPSLVITGPESGYFLQAGPLWSGNNVHVASSLFFTSDDWKTWTRLTDPCAVSPAPTDATLAASSSTDLVLDCDWVPFPEGGTAPAEYSNEYRDIYTSHDGGRTWVLSATTRAQRPARVGLMPSYRWGAAYYAGIQPAAVNSTTSLWVQPSSNALLHSGDGGLTWAPVSLGGGWELDLGGGYLPYSQWIDFADAEDGFLLAGGFFPDGPFTTAGYPVGLWRTTDGGDTWSEVVTFNETNISRGPRTLKQAERDAALALLGFGLANSHDRAASYVTTEVGALRSDPAFAATFRREYPTESATTRIWLFEVRGEFQLQPVCGDTYVATCGPPLGALTIAVVSGSLLPPLSVEISTNLSRYGTPRPLPISALNSCSTLNICGPVPPH